jgi:hypothetical protein
VGNVPHLQATARGRILPLTDDARAFTQQRYLTSLRSYYLFFFATFFAAFFAGFFAAAFFFAAMLSLLTFLPLPTLPHPTRLPTATGRASSI